MAKASPDKLKAMGAAGVVTVGSGLQAEGISAVIRMDATLLYLLVGLKADQYAAEMSAQLAG